MAPEITTEKQEVTTVEKAHPTEVIKTTTHVVKPPIQTEHPQKVYEKKKTIFRLYQVIWYIVAVVELLLAFRMTFKVLAANPFSGFAGLVYTLTNPLVFPFNGILAPGVSGNSVFEWSTIIAGFVYFLVAIGLVQLLQFSKPVTPEEVTQTVDNT